MANTCYWSMNAVNVHSIGPPGQVGIAVFYGVVDIVANAFVVLADGAFEDDFIEPVDTPVTQAQIVTAVQAAIQAREPGFPGLVFVPIVT